HTLLLVLARAGSKGLPDKNAASLAGKPLLAWTLDHAHATAATLDAPAVVALSTDSQRYLDLATQHHPDTAAVLRPARLATDTATVDAAARHAVETLEAERDATFAHIVILYANVPLRPTDLTARAIAKLVDTGCDSVQSLCPVGKHHPYWMKTLTGEAGDVLTPYVDNAVYRRQDLPPVYQLDGGVLAVARDSLFTVAEGQPHAFLGTDRRAITTAPGEVVDIDTPTDLALAEAVLAARA
ncbi:MAG: acylneuraminate cytidylyltransferase family protein, partial [Planctomycetota bacterium]